MNFRGKLGGGISDEYCTGQINLLNLNHEVPHCGDVVKVDERKDCSVGAIALIGLWSVVTLVTRALLRA